MVNEQKKKTAQTSSVGADEQRSISQKYNITIPDSDGKNNPAEDDFEEFYRQIQRMQDPAYLHTVTLDELMEQVFQGKAAVVENLLYTGAYILAGAPKIGKSFLVAQIAYHISSGRPLWGYQVRQGTVLYLALEDDEGRLQRRMYRMFGVEGANSLYFATNAKLIGSGLDGQLENFVQEHRDTRLIVIDTLQKVRETVNDTYSYSSDYYNPTTGEVYGARENVPESAAYAERAVKYRDVDYTVAALVAVPSALSYRYYGRDEFVMGAETFFRDTGTDSVMYYAFDTTEETNAAMEAFLRDYTENVNPQFDYESKATYAGEFESIKSMFLLLGVALSFIVGLVGILNFFNAILTGITARRRELAVLQSIGMTTRQMQTMLALEGLLYTLGSALLALAMILVTAPVVGPGLNGMFWFFTYHFTIWPIAVVLPLFALLGIAIPVATCRATQRYSVVERLRVE